MEDVETIVIVPDLIARKTADAQQPEYTEIVPPGGSAGRLWNRAAVTFRSITSIVSV